MPLWTGRFNKELDKITNDFNSSIHFDKEMWQEDIKGSLAHAKMLNSCNIINDDDYINIKNGLDSIFSELENGTLEFDLEKEDIHSFIEGELTKRTESGKRLHTARSRNDQVALDIRLYLIKETNNTIKNLSNLMGVLFKLSKEHTNTIMPGLTHLQPAQPITFSHHLMAYAHMFMRDIDRLKNYVSNYKFENVTYSPLGACALASTTYNIDRNMVAKELSLSGITTNSLDSVSDRDFIIELLSHFSILMMHLSRFSEEIILWCSNNYKYIELDDAFSTGSSIMPQKKNPDIAELVRGKSGRVFGHLQSILVTMKGLPLAYNKDMQEDKEAIFDAIKTVNMCLISFTPMLSTLKVNAENMRKASANGFINATDCADFLVSKGKAFRDAYKTTGEIVFYCIENNFTLEDLPLDIYKNFDEFFDENIYDIVNLDNCVNRRTAIGGPSPSVVLEDIKRLEHKLKEILDEN